MSINFGYEKLQLISVILGIVAFFTGYQTLYAILLTMFIIWLLCLKLIPNKIAVLSLVFFILSAVYADFRIKESDELSLNMPADAVVTGVVISIPTTYSEEKTKFYIS